MGGKSSLDSKKVESLLFAERGGFAWAGEAAGIGARGDPEVLAFSSVRSGPLSHPNPHPKKKPNRPTPRTQARARVIEFQTPRACESSASKNAKSLAALSEASSRAESYTISKKRG